MRRRRQTIGNWLYHDNMPPFEKILSILATLNIPMAELLAAYREAGVPTPTLDYAERLDGPGATRPPTTPGRSLSAQAERVATEAEEWRETLEQTRRVMLATGFPPAALDALLANLTASHAGQAPLSQRAFEEFANPDTGPTGSARSSAPQGAGSTMSPCYRDRNHQPGQSGTSERHDSTGPSQQPRPNDNDK